MTDKGLNHVDLIASYLYYYIEMLKKEGPQKWVFDEIKAINKLKFDNVDRKHGMNVCAKWTSMLHTCPMEEVLVRDYLMEEWKPELIANYLDQLTPKNHRITVSSQKFASVCDQT